jgi:hypothetical protein
MKRLSEILHTYGFAKAGDQNHVNYYARMKDGGLLSISLSAASYCIPRMLLDPDSYDAIEIGFVKGGELYDPVFLSGDRYHVVRGILAYFPVEDFADLTRLCFGEPGR